VVLMEMLVAFTVLLVAIWILVAVALRRDTPSRAYREALERAERIHRLGNEARRAMIDEIQRRIFPRR
jgi:hypothetical protein